MICSNCSEPIPRDAIVVEGDGGAPVCPKCSGMQGSTLGQDKDIDSVSMSTQEEIELGRELFEGAGQLKGQKIERAQIVVHLREMARQIRAALPASGDAVIVSSIALAIEKRDHWTQMKGSYDGE